MKFDSQTIISISLQARDWHYLGHFMKGNEAFDDLSFDLKSKFQVASPPTGTTLVEATNQYLGDILHLFHKCHKEGSKEIGKNVNNRFRTALGALSVTEINTWLTAYDAEEQTVESTLQEIGRKFLRGKLG